MAIHQKHKHICVAEADNVFPKKTITNKVACFTTDTCMCAMQRELLDRVQRQT